MIRRLLLLMFGFVVGYWLADVTAVTAQDGGSRTVNVDTDPASFDPRAAPRDLTVKEIIDILVDYDVKHVVQQPFAQPMYGATDYESTPPAIWIFETADRRSREETVIHELLHIHYRNAGREAPEDFIRSEEGRQFQQLFGTAQ